MTIKYGEYVIEGTVAEVFEFVHMVDIPEKKEEDADADQEPKKPKAASKKRKPLDVGKMKALRKAEWSLAKIADEMRVSPQTVANYLKKEGVA